ncbi:glycosyltransferase family 2 protein [Bifidobacterium callimiconis]|uniref:glycosyltransferase family 2 protein n=1 Tax=Bifidobacterium callimiconis TaxID=2306973 RepID=UPI001BDD3F62|nr:glycosyltransferase family 2 protein [Bifidobacterium callimiconis]MBT1177880.1 glycosyltransferase family 2 protein [Bifidobacterium callimiconis]
MSEEIQQAGHDPKVSVIMSVYNAAPYLEQSIGSLLDQTFTDYEILCVDDGSTDDSRKVISHLADSHPQGSRIKLIRTAHVGLGAARNIALQQARGQYIAFLDADDWADPELLRKAVTKADDLQADIVIWDIWFMDHKSGQEIYPPVGTLNFHHFDDGSGTFSYEKNPDYIFTSFQNWVWNKLFRREFLRENNIESPNLARTEDLEFTCLALVEAQRIAVIYERLVKYRINRGSSNMDTVDLHPLDFLTAFVNLKEELIRRGIYPNVRMSYINWALSSALFNLSTQARYETFLSVFNALRDYGFHQMDITDQLTRDDVQNESWWNEYQTMLSSTPEELLLHYLRDTRRNEAFFICELNKADREKNALHQTVQEQHGRITELESLLDQEHKTAQHEREMHAHWEQEAKATRDSITFKVGRIAVFPLHAAKRLIQAIKK